MAPANIETATAISIRAAALRTFLRALNDLLILFMSPTTDFSIFWKVSRIPVIASRGPESASIASPIFLADTTSPAMLAIAKTLPNVRLLNLSLT